MNTEALHPTIQRLEKALKDKGWKKNKFCGAVSISTQNYNNWRARGIPSAKMLKAANAVGVTREWLEGNSTATTPYKINEPPKQYSISDDNIGNAIIFATTEVLKKLQELNLANEIKPDIIGNMIKYAYENNGTKSKEKIADNIVAFIKIADSGIK